MTVKQLEDLAVIVYGLSKAIDKGDHRDGIRDVNGICGNLSDLIMKTCSEGDLGTPYSMDIVNNIIRVMEDGPQEEGD